MTNRPQRRMRAAVAMRPVAMPPGRLSGGGPARRASAQDAIDVFSSRTAKNLKALITGTATPRDLLLPDQAPTRKEAHSETHHLRG